MREIKFRAWDEQQEEFHYFGVVNDNKNLVEDGCFGQGYIEINAEQYTGLKDKNGKEIYEGDLIEVHENKNGSFEVVFVNAYVGGWVLKHNDDPLLSLGARSTKDIEIIGNIHE